MESKIPSGFAVATMVKIAAAHVQSLPHWVRLLTRWRRKTVILLTKSRSSTARHQNQFQKEERAVALAAVRHQKSSLLISAQEKTQSEVKSQVNPGQAAGDRLHVPGVQATKDWSRMVQQSHVPRPENQARQRVTGCISCAPLEIQKSRNWERQHGISTVECQTSEQSEDLVILREGGQFSGESLTDDEWIFFFEEPMVLCTGPGAMDASSSANIRKKNAEVAMKSNSR